MSEDNNVSIEVDTAAGNRSGSSSSRTRRKKKSKISVNLNYGTKTFDPNDHKSCDRCNRLPEGVMVIDVSGKDEKAWYEGLILCGKHKKAVEEKYERKRSEPKWYSFLEDDEDE